MNFIVNFSCNKSNGENPQNVTRIEIERVSGDDVILALQNTKGERPSFSINEKSRKVNIADRQFDIKTWQRSTENLCWAGGLMSGHWTHLLLLWLWRCDWEVDETLSDKVLAEKYARNAITLKDLEDAA